MFIQNSPNTILMSRKTCLLNHQVHLEFREAVCGSLLVLFVDSFERFATLNKKKQIL